MRLRLIVALAFAALAVAAGPDLRSTPAATARAERDNLVGVWTGTWTDGNAGAHGGGTLVLELESGRLIGEFAGGPDVPVRYGLLDLTRKS